MKWIPVTLLSVLFVVNACDLNARQNTLSCSDPFKDAEFLNFDPRGWKTDFCVHKVPFEEIESGGPPRDGIPPIDNPTFVSIDEADGWINGKEPVILLQIGAETRAYPLQILTWHEIVNDELGGQPVAVTFCPLCYAVLVFERPRMGDQLLTFGTTGNLRNSDLVMWDRQTETWWQQFSGEAIVGQLTGMVLKSLPARLISWDEFKAGFPEGSVLSKNTGHQRRYGQNPYVGYDDVNKQPWMYRGEVGAELPPMERVIGIEMGEKSRAYALKRLRKQGVINDRVEGRDVVLFWKKGTNSALDDELISRSRDIGATGVYSRIVGEQSLTFEDQGDKGYKDQETGSRWNLLGEAIEGPLKGEQLEPLVHHNIFWFVWSAFKPNGSLYQ